MNSSFHTTQYCSGKLSEYIDGYTVYHFEDDSPVWLNPGGYFELIFQINGEFKQKTTNTEEWKSRPKYFVGGLHQESYFIKPEQKKSQIISVQFKPNCSKYFIPDKLHLYKNRITNLKETYKVDSIRSLNRLHEKDSIQNDLKTIESFLKGIYRKHSKSPIDKALTQIILNNGFVNINNLAKSAFLSNSQFRKRFNEEVGMSPKEYSKIMRIKFISRLLKGDLGINLTELTYKLGYFDQSHFIKDFKSVTGLSPMKFMKMQLAQ